MSLVQQINQNSFLIAATVVLCGWLVAILARRSRGRAWLAWLAGAAFTLGAFLVLRTAAPQPFASAADVQRAVSAGRPSLVEFYSDY